MALPDDAWPVTRHRTPSKVFVTLCVSGLRFPPLENGIVYKTYLTDGFVN